MVSKIYNYVDIEQKWQEKWYQKKIYEAKIEHKKKFLIHFAYPGVSGFLHVGHMRGFTYCDIIARFKRMNGFDVLFPAGFHASGIPSIGFSKKIERNDKPTIKMLEEYGYNDETIKKLSDPNEVVKFFGDIYVNDYWKKFGFLIDYSRIMSTISPGYKKFIQWQFYKLKLKKLLIQKPHYAPLCPNCGPVAVDKSETDISKGGGSEILEFTTIKFKMDDGIIIPAATLRPETIFGITNIWVNPDVNYLKIKINGETWICSKEAAKKLSFQYDDVKIIEEEISGKDLIGKKCVIPLINRSVPILSGTFADPDVATGIVMSVPAHAPYDHIALVDSGEKIDPITIIDVKDLGLNPAKKVCDELGIKNQNETEKLDEATDIVYKKEFHTGYLNENCGKYAGIKISEIKDQVKEELISNNDALIMREFSEEVICRCGEKVVIKQIPDQWFIKYSDFDLKTDSKKHTANMLIFPEDYKEELPGIIDWFDDRACIRKGSWLGTEFPFKKDWIIEPISDSTLYPAYYIISKYVNNNKIKPKEMNEKFFDYIFLSKGSAENPIWDEIKKDFDYWYPVDINLGGKEHKTVHFPVFLMNHVAIMPFNKFPKGIFVHWWVTQKGKEKISKSKGGAEHIAEAAKLYGVDAMRLYYTHVGSPFVDIEWNSEAVLKYKNKIANIYNFIIELFKIDGEKNNNLDLWLISRINKKIIKINDGFNIYNLRIASNEIFFECQKDIQWYIKRGGANKKVIFNYIDIWLRLMAPITPHIAEELWSINNKNIISNENYPVEKTKDISEKVEVGEFLLTKLIDDSNEIIKVTKIKPKRIIIYVSPKWKWVTLRKALELSKENKFNVGILIKDLLADENMKKFAKQISKFVGNLKGEIKKFNENDKKRYSVEFDSFDYLEKSKDYLEKIFSCDIEIYRSDDKKINDPSNKSVYASPLRPAIYIE